MGALLRQLGTAELRLAPGRVIAARVVDVQPGAKASLSIAGAIVDATLPAHVKAGEELRLIVAEVTPDKVVLKLDNTGQVPVGLPPLPLPGGGHLQVTEREARSASGGSAASHSVALRYEAPALGPMDLSFTLAPGGLRVAVRVSDGETLARANAAARELQRVLAAKLDAVVTVTASARHDPLDVYA